MPYITGQNMIDRYGDEEILQLTDPQNLVTAVMLQTALAGGDMSGFTADEQAAAAAAVTKLQDALDDAAAEIDSCLAGRYTLPLSEVPAALTRIACEIARYQLYDDAPTETVKDRYDNAIKFLRSVAKGEIRLVQSNGATATPENFVEIDPGRTVFNNGGGF